MIHPKICEVWNKHGMYFVQCILYIQYIYIHLMIMFWIYTMWTFNIVWTFKCIYIYIHMYYIYMQYLFVSNNNSSYIHAAMCCYIVYIYIYTLGNTQFVSDHFLCDPKMFENHKLRMIYDTWFLSHMPSFWRFRSLYPRSYSDILILFLFPRALVCFMD